jgi:hypothetical protein
MDPQDRFDLLVDNLKRHLEKARVQLAVQEAVIDEVAEFLGRPERPNPCDCDPPTMCWDHRLERAMNLVPYAAAKR